MTMTPLGARRLREMVELGERIATTAFSGRGEPVLPDLGAVRDAIRSRRFAVLTR